MLTTFHCLWILYISKRHTCEERPSPAPSVCGSHEPIPQHHLLKVLMWPPLSHDHILNAKSPSLFSELWPDLGHFIFLLWTVKTPLLVRVQVAEPKTSQRVYVWVVCCFTPPRVWSAAPYPLWHFSRFVSHYSKVYLFKVPPMVTGDDTSWEARLDKCLFRDSGWIGRLFQMQKSRLWSSGNWAEPLTARCLLHPIPGLAAGWQGSSNYRQAPPWVPLVVAEPLDEKHCSRSINRFLSLALGKWLLKMLVNLSRSLE